MLAALEAYGRARHEWPTAYELLEWFRADHPRFDPNSIRPRLTSLRDKGLVVGDRKRRCQVTGRIAWTWATAATKALPTASEPQPGDERPARQAVLDLNWSGHA